MGIPNKQEDNSYYNIPFCSISQEVEDDDDNTVDQQADNPDGDVTAELQEGADSPPLVHFYEDGKLVPLTEGYLAERKAVAAKALEDTRAKYEELERTVKEISIK